MQKYEFMRDLYHDAGSVAGLPVTAFSAPVGHVFQYGESFFDDVVVFAAVNVYDKTNTAGVVLVFWGVETTCLKIFKCVHILVVKFAGKFRKNHNTISYMAPKIYYAGPLSA